MSMTIPMTLRTRLLLLYLMVVLLASATILLAILESEHARRIYGALQPWNDMALTAQKLQSALATLAATRSQEAGDRRQETGGRHQAPVASRQAQDLSLDQHRDQDTFLTLIVSQYPKLNEAAEYRNVDPVREALNTLNLRFRDWQEREPHHQVQRLDDLRLALRRYADLVDTVLAQLRLEKSLQQTRSRSLLAGGAGLTLVYLLVIGSVLRRWILRPIEQLGRQVDALALDQPPPEPLLTAPAEMADLAAALDHARRSLQSLRQQLIDAERLTTIGQVAAQIAHNLRNPLASIRAVAQWTARHAEADSDLQIRMRETVASVDRMNRWIAGIMEIAQKHPTAAHPGDVVPTLNRVAEAVRLDLAAKDLRLELNLPADGLICMHHPDSLEHALVAMVTNAIEASPLGATIRLIAERLKTEPPTSPVTGNQSPTANPDDRPVAAGPCRISVIDQGAGLPVDDPEQVFAFAYSTKTQGMGLGLALAREALRRQGGSIHAVNNPDHGATVYVELDAASDPPTDASPGFDFGKEPT